MAYSKERLTEIYQDPEWKRKNYERVKEWRKTHQQNRAAEARRWRANHPELAREIKQRYREKSREERLPREAGLARKWREANPEAFLKVRQSQDKQRRDRQEQIAGRPRPDRCEVCGMGSTTYICFDHCHQSGVFRGWICDRCNKTLGHVKDDPELLRKLAEYVERHNGKNDLRSEEETAE